MESAPITFGGHRLNTATRQLFRGEVELHLSPKAFDLLHTLIDNRTRAVSKAELHERLWPGTFVTEANLVSLIAEVRRVLDDPPKDSRFVRTVHRFGYAFCGEIAGEGRTDAIGGSCWIVWRSRELPLREGENIIGRDEGVEIRIDAPSVSRRHARITVSGERVGLEDLGSKNGTQLHQKPVLGVVALADMDEIQVGTVVLIVRIMRDSATTQTVER